MASLPAEQSQALLAWLRPAGASLLEGTGLAREGRARAALFADLRTLTRGWLSAEELAWGLAVFFSRRFELPAALFGDTLGLLPIVDLLNSGPSLEGLAGVDGHVQLGAPQVLFHAGAAGPAGAQVFLSYGDLSDATLLLNFGFLPEARQQGNFALLEVPFGRRGRLRAGLLARALRRRPGGRVQRTQRTLEGVALPVLADGRLGEGEYLLWILLGRRAELVRPRAVRSLEGGSMPRAVGMPHTALAVQRYLVGRCRELAETSARAAPTGKGAGRDAVELSAEYRRREAAIWRACANVAAARVRQLLGLPGSAGARAQGLPTTGALLPPGAAGTHGAPRPEPCEASSIFVMVPASDDPECPFTLKSLFQEAACPRRLHVGVCDQVSLSGASCAAGLAAALQEDRWNVPEEVLTLLRSKVRFLEGAAAGSQGQAPACDVAQELLGQAKFVLRVDSATRFSRRWDDELIGGLRAAEAASPSGLAVLTVHPGLYVGSGDEARPVTCAENHPFQKTNI